MEKRAKTQRCLQCAKRPVAQGWRCSICRADFGPMTRSDQRAALGFLQEQARTLATAADRLDGAGFWAVAKAVWSATEKVERLASAIANEESAGPEETAAAR